MMLTNGHSGALFSGQMPFDLRFSLDKCPKPSWQGFRPPLNQGNAHLNLENSSLKKCPKPFGQGFRPTHPYGQCPNRGDANFCGASLRPMKSWKQVWAGNGTRGTENRGAKGRPARVRGTGTDGRARRANGRTNSGTGKGFGTGIEIHKSAHGLPVPCKARLGMWRNTVEESSI